MDNPAYPVPHEWGCECPDCKWMIEAITAQDDAGGYLFSTEELEKFAAESDGRGAPE